MAKEVKEIRGFIAGTIFNASEEDISGESNSFSLNVNPIAQDGILEGINAVVDKDLSAALLGRVLKSNELWIITDIDKVYLNFGSKNQEPLREITSLEAEKYQRDGHFQVGTMHPKIKAALYFLKHHGQKVVITSIDGVEEAINGNNGTIIRN